MFPERLPQKLSLAQQLVPVGHVEQGASAAFPAVGAMESGRRVFHEWAYDTRNSDAPPGIDV
jgi:hypothetical protein